MTIIHTHRTEPAGALVNAYLVETSDGLVAVDSTLTVSDGRALRRRADQTGKPLVAVLLTHSHPDHYGGLTELLAGEDVPIFATAGVAEVIRRDDPVKERILRPMFGDEWPVERTFPNRTVRDGETLRFGEASFIALDLGPGESPHDSTWILGEDTVFLGDQVYDRMHAYLADGHYESWLAHLDRLERELPADAVLHIGHGGPVDRAMFAWQACYIETFLDAIARADWSNPDAARIAVIAKVKQYLPTDALQFLMELSIDPIAARLGVLDQVRS